MERGTAPAAHSGRALEPLDADSTAASSRFVREAHALVRDLLEPQPIRYWTDFLITVGVAYSALAVYLTAASTWMLEGASLMVAALAMYRAMVFTHEIAHQTAAPLKSFQVAWNALCGVPCLMPSFLYGNHNGHHINHAYGTRADPEYLLHGSKSRVRVVAFLCLSAVYPFLVLVRFLLFTPLAVLWRPVDRFVWTCGSSLYVMNESYRREFDARATARSRWFQELACSAWAWTLVALAVAHRVSPQAIWKTYCVFLVWIGINQIRTLAAHRYRNDVDTPATYLDQVLDTNTFAQGRWLPELWAPLGMRYHALHHLIPSLPYHAMEKAHQRLMEGLPPRSPYHRTLMPGLWPALTAILRGREAAEAR
jgi:fatty acid desaturase